MFLPAKERYQLLRVDPAVRREVAQLAPDVDKHQGDFINEALNLLFEKSGKPPIA